MVHLITGLPGAGKSEVARLISESIRALVVNTDTVRDRLFTKRTTNLHGDFTDEQIRAVYSTITTLAYYLVVYSPEKHLVLDGSFRYEQQRRSIIDEMKRIEHQIQGIYVRADPDIIRKRLEYRHNLGQHQATFATYQRVEQIYEKPLDYYEIDNSGSLVDLESKVKTYLSAWI